MFLNDILCFRLINVPRICKFGFAAELILYKIGSSEPLFDIILLPLLNMLKQTIAPVESVCRGRQHMARAKTHVCRGRRYAGARSFAAGAEHCKSCRARRVNFCLPTLDAETPIFARADAGSNQAGSQRRAPSVACDCLAPFLLARSACLA